MLTIHAADLLWPGRPHTPAVRGGALAVDGDRIVALGPYPEVAAGHPTARVRHWPGLLAPGLVNPAAPTLLETVYHPDPQEPELGDQPITDPAAVAALGMTDARWGHSARRGAQRMLRHGTTAVVGPFGRPAVRTALARSGLVVLPAVAQDRASTPDLDPLRALSAGVEPATAFAGALAAGARADCAVFEVSADGSDPGAALVAAGAASCVATVLAGRLVYRRR